MTAPPMPPLRWQDLTYWSLTENQEKVRGKLSTYGNVIELMQAKTINKLNLLKKLSFLQSGEARSAESLHHALNAFLRSQSEKTVSPQTIRYWFEKNSAPSRHEAFRFLYDYIRNEIQYDKITSEQKKVYTQIESFLRQSIASKSPEKSSEKIYFSTKGRLVLNVDEANNSASNIINKQFLGTYITYRMRLSENDVDPIASEVLRIFRRNKELRFEHWFNSEGIEITKFEGVVCISGHVVWMFGNVSAGDRLRVMNFKFDRSITSKYSKVKWGIMVSDTSIPSMRDPAACRIVLIRQEQEIKNIHSFIKENTKFCRLDQIDVKNHQSLWRLINNFDSAVSLHRTSIPLIKYQQTRSFDTILKVNQSTVEVVCEEFE